MPQGFQYLQLHGGESSLHRKDGSHMILDWHIALQSDQHHCTSENKRLMCIKEIDVNFGQAIEQKM